VGPVLEPWARAVTDNNTYQWRNYGLEANRSSLEALAASAGATSERLIRELS